MVPACQELGIDVTPWGVLGQGILTGKLRRESGFDGSDSKRAGWHSSVTEQQLDVAEKVVEVAEKLGVSPAQVAVNWSVRQPAIATSIVGSRTVKQLQSNIDALSFTIPAELMEVRQGGSLGRGWGARARARG